MGQTSQTPVEASPWCGVCGVRDDGRGLNWTGWTGLRDGDPMDLLGLISIKYSRIYIQVGSSVVSPIYLCSQPPTSSVI